MHSKSVNNNQATLKHSWSIRKWHEISKVCLALALSILAAGIIFLSLSALPIEASCSFLGCGVLLLVLIHIKKGSSDNSSTPISQGVQTNALPSSVSMTARAGATNERIIIGSGKITKRTFDLPEDLNLEKLDLCIYSLPVEYVIRQGDKNSIQIVTDDNINSYIYTILEESNLGLYCHSMNAEKTFHFEKMNPSQPVQCEIILKTMFNKLAVSGSGRTHLTTFSGEKRNLKCDMPCLNIDNMQLEIEGQLGDLILYLNGNATFSGEKLNCDHADLQLYDNSKVINLNVSEKPQCKFYNGFNKGTGSCTYTLPGQPPTVMKAHIIPSR